MPSLPRRTDKFIFLLFLVGGLRLLALSTLLCLAVCWSLELQPWGIPRPVIWPQITHILLALPHMLFNIRGCTSHSIGSLDGLIIGVLTIFFGPVFPIGEKWAHRHIGQLHCSHSTDVRGTRMFCNPEACPDFPNPGLEIGFKVIYCLTFIQGTLIGVTKFGLIGLNS